MSRALLFQEAVQFPETAFRDPLLRRADVETDALGLPRVASGAYAVVFRLHTDDGLVAVKAFTADDPHRAARYAALERHLAASPVPEIVPFRYLAGGLVAEDRAYDVLAMPWAEAAPLDRYVAAHVHDGARMQRLADAWDELVQRLDTSAIAHGDLHHGNVLVEEAGEDVRLRLIDLDAAHVPGLRRRPVVELGHRNYVHPDRTAEADPALADRFPALVIHAALHALAVRPDLWATYHTGENLLVSASDAFEPSASALFDDLASDERTASLAEVLRRASRASYTSVPPLSDVLGGAEWEAVAGRTARSGRRGVEQWMAPLLVGAVAVGALSFGAEGAAIALVTWVALAIALWRRTEAFRRPKRLRNEATRYAKDVRDLDHEDARLCADADALIAGIGEARARRLAEVQAEALNERLKHHFIEQTGAVVPHRVVVRLKGANLRTAVHVTPERLAAVEEIGDASRAAVLAWRDGLAARYAADVPGALPDGEARRLDAQRRHRLDQLDRQRARLQERREALQAEQADLEQRLTALPPFGLLGYVRFLLLAGPPPPVAQPPPCPAPPAPRIDVEAGTWWDAAETQNDDSPETSG